LSILSKPTKKDTVAGVQFLDIVKPDFSTGTAEQVLLNVFGLAGQLKPLDSERDLNFRVTTPDGKQYLFKISNHKEPADNIDFEIAALNHIARTAPDLPVPRIQATRSGSYFGSAVAKNGVVHKVRLLTFLPGTVLSDVTRTNALIFDQGKTTARMALAMRGFFHPAAGSRKLLWDVRQVESLRPIAEKLTDQNSRTLVLRIIENFRLNVRPRLAALRGQVAHMDLTRDNMVVDEHAPEVISGVLDFGDMHHGPLIQDVAIAIADVMQPDLEPMAKAQVFLRGYHHVLALQPEEIELLYDLILVYFVTYYLILMRRGDSYYAANPDSVLTMIETLQQWGRDKVTDWFSQSCGHPRPKDIAPGDVDALIARRKSVMGAPLYVFYDPPLNIVSGNGIWLSDSAGTRYLDVYNNVPVAGHAHPYVAQAVARQTARLSTNTRYVCDEIIAYAERLTGTLPEGLGNTFFVNSGSEANDLAWLMAEAYTGNQGAIVAEDAYHGWTKAVAALSPSGKPDSLLSAHVRTIPIPDTYRSPHKTLVDLLTHHAECVDEAIESLTRAGLKLALCMIDPAFCSNGVPELLPGFLPMLFEKVRNAGGLCAADEVQSGFGRMGSKMWGFDLHGAIPDIVTFGKPMANGYPMGAVVTRPDILASVSEGGAIFATFGGNNVAAAAANAVLDVYYDENLLQNSTSTGKYLKIGLQELATKYDIIGDVRGSGLILGVELVQDKKTKSPAAKQTENLLQIMSDTGVVMGSDGPYDNVLKLRPPLIFTKAHADLLLEKLDNGLAQL
jgi:4-aminobutyrate aminotransferase-like enzyme/Ser/Thr protein kinase RdoA (MazF antagonist)